MTKKNVLAMVMSLLILAIFVSLLPEGELRGNIMFFGSIGVITLIFGGLVIYGVKGVYEYLTKK